MNANNSNYISEDYNAPVSVMCVDGLSGEVLHFELFSNGVLSIDGVEIEKLPKMQLVSWGAIVIAATGEIMIAPEQRYISDYIRKKIIKTMLG